MKILVINPGSTSTKIALFEDGRQLWDDTQRYDTDVIGGYKTVADQHDFRLAAIKDAMAKHGLKSSDLDAVVGRGGLMKPIVSGTYAVNDAMLADLESAQYGSHASNLGAGLALSLAREGGCGKAFIVDPVVVDELMDVARVTGLPQIQRRSVFHALNQKAIARKAAAELGKAYEECNFIVAHMGGGITVGAHDHGRVIDVTNGVDGEGAFSPERSGALPAGGVAALCFSGQYSQDQIKKLINGKGGLVAHLGTNDLREVCRRVEAGDAHAKLIFQALAYQVAREIGARAVTLRGKVDAIVLTGGLSYSEAFDDEIRQWVGFIAPVKVYPGEDELRALAEGGARVLSGAEAAKIYV